MNDSIKLLNLKEEEIDIITSHIENNVLYINLTLRRKDEECPNCKSILNKVESYRNKQINHPMLNSMKCIVNYRCRRLRCITCNKTFNESNTFVKKSKHATDYEVFNVLNLLKSPHITFTDVAKQCNISVTKVQYIFDKHVNITRRKLPRVLSIDEYYEPATGIGKYDCLWLDFEKNEVIDVLPDRTKWHLQKYLQGRTRLDRESVEFVSIDMWETYRYIAKTYLKNAKICVDSFHVIKNILNALDKIRIKVMNRQEEHSINYYLLKKFNFLLQTNFRNIKKNKKQYNHKLDKFLNYHDILNLLINIDDELSTAYFIKENYIDFNDTATLENAEVLLNKQIDIMISKNIPEFNDVYKMLQNWKQEIINSFNLSCDGKRINNSVIEGRNKTIKQIIDNANGVTNFNRLRNRIMYCINNEMFSIDEHPNTVKRKGNKRGNYKNKSF